MKKIIFFTFLFFIGMQVIVFARVMVINHSSKLKITLLDGRVLNVLPHEEAPSIPDGAIIEAINDFTSDVVSADIKINDDVVHLIQGKKIQIVEHGSNGGFIVLKGKVTVQAKNGSIKILSPIIDSLEESYHPPPIPDPIAMEKKIQGDEALPDISPIYSNHN